MGSKKYPLLDQTGYPYIYIIPKVGYIKISATNESNTMV